MDRYCKSGKLFEKAELCSDSSSNSVVYISSDKETSDDWDSDWSTDTEEIIRRVETEVMSSPILIAGRIRTTDSMKDKMVAGPSSSQPQQDKTPKLDERYSDEKMCYAPQKGPSKNMIELCRTLIPVKDSPKSPSPHLRGPTTETPLMQPVRETFRASFHIQDSLSCDNVNEQQCRGCLVCGRSVDLIKMEKVNEYMRRSTPSGEPKQVTDLRREAYLNGLKAGTLLFLIPAVSATNIQRQQAVRRPYQELCQYIKLSPFIFYVENVVHLIITS